MLELLPAVALGLTAVGYGLRRVALALAGALGWLASGVYAYTQSTSLWDTYYILFWLFIGIALAVVVDSLYLMYQEQAENNQQERLDEQEEKRQENIQDRKDNEDGLNAIDKIRKKHGLHIYPRANRAIANRSKRDIESTNPYRKS